jgi:hypothetical protein
VASSSRGWKHCLNVAVVVLEMAALFLKQRGRLKGKGIALKPVSSSPGQGIVLEATAPAVGGSVASSLEESP